jgi:pyridoxine 5-phosphate synthase
VILFIAPDRAQLEASAALRVEQVELHTGEYAHAFPQGTQELARLHGAAKEGHSLGLEVAAGHGLTRANVEEVVATPDIVELNIGHALVADALFLSLAGATKAMNEAIARGVGRRP